MQVWGSGNVEEGGSFANEFRSRRRLGIEISIEVLGENVEEVYDTVGHGLPDLAVLDKEVLRVLREERGSGHPDGRGTVGPDDGEGVLRESDPVHEVSVVLDVLDGNGVAMEFAVRWDQGDLRRLDLGDRVERCRSLADAERDRELAPTGLGMNAEGCVTFGVQDGSAGSVEGGAKVGSALEVSEDADELDEVALCGIRVMGGCHDDCDLYLAAYHEEMDEAPDDSLILLLVDRGGILGVFKEVHGVGRSLGWERVRAAGRENLEDGMEHGCSESTGDGVKVESYAEVAVHGGFVEDAGVTLVQLEDGLVPEAAASEDRGAIVNMGVEDHH